MRFGWLTIPIALALALPARAQVPVEPGGLVPPREIVTGVRFAGEVVAQEADRLRDLLAMEVGEPYSPAAVRETLELYYQKGLFSSIAVEKVPAAGGVALVFHFTRLPRLMEWTFRDNRHLRAEVLERALDLNWGEPLSPEEFPRYEQIIRDRYQREGFMHASARFRVEPLEGPGRKLVIDVDEGDPLVVSRVRLLDSGPLEPKAVLRALGIEAGERIRRDALRDAIERLQAMLTEIGALNNRIAYYYLLPDGSRVANYTLLVERKPPTVELVVAIEPGVQGLVVVEGEVLLPERLLDEAITVYEHRSYSAYELDQSAERLRKLYVSRGYPEAEVSHELEPVGDRSYRIVFRVAAGPQIEVVAVEFEGNQAYPDEALARLLATRRRGLFGAGGIFDPAVWDEDLLRIRHFYRTNGFLDASVTRVERRLAPGADALTLVVHIQEGPRTIVSRLLFTGVSAFHEAGILQALPIHPGEPFNPYLLGEYISSVEAYYAKSGYPLARVEAELVTNGSPETAALRFAVTPGPRKRLGEIVLRGNLKTNDDVVRRELTLRRGMWYNSEALLQTQQQIYQLGFFDRVNVSPIRPISDDPTQPVDLVVAVQERETGWVGVGGGFGDLQGPQASIEFTQRNLWGTGRPVMLEAIASQKLQELSFALRDPYAFDQKLIGEVGFAAQRDATLIGRDYISYGPNLGLSKQVTESTLVSARYTWGRTNYLQATPEDLRATGGLLDYTNSVVAGSVTYDSRSDLMNPRWGTKADLNVDLALPFAGGTLLYTRPRLALAHYIPLTRRIVLAVGAEAGYVQTLGQTETVPTNVLFIAGGAQSLRGFQRNEIRPGRGLLLSRAELRFPVWGDFGGVVFTDAGNLWSTPQDLSLGDLRVTAGPGVRYQTPIGPVRVDLAFRVRPTVEFGAVHFGLGQAF